MKRSIRRIRRLIKAKYHGIELSYFVKYHHQRLHLINCVLIALRLITDIPRRDMEGGGR